MLTKDIGIHDEAPPTVGDSGESLRVWKLCIQKHVLVQRVGAAWGESRRGGEDIRFLGELIVKSVD